MEHLSYLLAHIVIDESVINQRYGFHDNIALIIAASQGHDEIVQLLLDAKANIEITTHNNTALDEAIKNKKLSTTSILLSYGAIIHNPQQLFDFLQDSELCDQRDPDVLNSLYYLSAQLSQMQNHDILLNKVNSYLQKLQQLTYVHQTNLTNTVEQATHQVIPDVLCDVVSQLDMCLERLSIFRPKEIDTLITEAPAKRQKIQPTP